MRKIVSASVFSLIRFKRFNPITTEFGMGPYSSDGRNDFIFPPCTPSDGGVSLDDDCLRTSASLKRSLVTPDQLGAMKRTSSMVRVTPPDQETSPYRVGFNFFVGGASSGSDDSYAMRMEYFSSPSPAKGLSKKVASFDNLVQLGLVVSPVALPDKEPVRVVSSPFEDVFRLNSDSSDLLEGQVYIYAPLKKTIESLAEGFSSEKRIHFLCQAGFSRSAIMAAGTICYFAKNGMITAEIGTKDRQILDVLQSPTVSYFDKVQQLLAFMAESQKEAGRPTENLLHPRGWFRFQLAVLLLHFDKNIQTPEGRMGFQVLCENFKTHFQERLSVGEDIGKLDVVTFYPKDVLEMFKSVTTESDSFNKLYALFCGELASNFV